ncbi:hypothetical protein SDC9_90505 [bioreactor metagenome]|uniref:VTT domain-containing protein n=1 Tax=bioreactor metagenome TaxID=1076179 RepID=A0A644ZTV5_9ZZZZ
MTEMIAEHLDSLTAYAAVWGFLLIFIFMTIESSFIPFPSEVVMIPAGFLAFRGGLTTQIPMLDLILAIIIGLAGSMAGAYVNYYLAIWLGRPFLHRYGKYFFLSEPALDRAEEVFREYGEVATFVCRMLPAIRQLISIPAGLAKMNFGRFSLFTALGAGIWVIILALLGWYFAHMAGDMTYLEMIERGKAIINENYIWILLALAVLVAGYMMVHRKIMHRKDA